MGFVFVPVLIFILSTGEVEGPWVSNTPFNTMTDCENALLTDANKMLIANVRRQVLEAHPGATIEKEGNMCMQQPAEGERGA